MQEQYKIGIIDDDQSKVTQMITMIRLCCNDEEGHPIKEKYAICGKKFPRNRLNF